MDSDIVWRTIISMSVAGVKMRWIGRRGENKGEKAYHGSYRKSGQKSQEKNGMACFANG